MTTSVLPPPSPLTRLFPLPVHRFTVKQYHKMIATGVLTENDRVELLEGWIVDKIPQLPAHAGTISVLEVRLRTRLPRGWIVRLQSPITLEDSEPEPDLAVVPGPEERYLTAHPRPDEVALVVEVSDSSLENDRTVKLRAYARARIPVYWIVNLVEMVVEVYTQPRAGRSPTYRQRESLGIEDGIPITIGGRELTGIPVRHLFP